jgi:hypothetical protein
MTRSEEFGRGHGYWSPEYKTTMPKLYHGTDAEFNVGDLVDVRTRANNIFKGDMSKFSPAHDDESLDLLHSLGYGIKKHEGESFAFASDDPEISRYYGKNLYEVEPVNHSEVVHLEPGEFGAHSGFRVIGKI